MFDFLVGYVMGERAAARAASFARGAAASSASATTGELYDLDQRVDRLLLVVDALWTLLKDQGMTDEDLIARIRQLDEADGVVDGRRRTAPARCSKCDSMVEPGRTTCSICGAEMPTGDAGPLDRI